MESWRGDDKHLARKRWARTMWVCLSGEPSDVHVLAPQCKLPGDSWRRLSARRQTVSQCDGMSGSEQGAGIMQRRDCLGNRLLGGAPA